MVKQEQQAGREAKRAGGGWGLRLGPGVGGDVLVSTCQLRGGPIPDKKVPNAGVAGEGFEVRQGRHDSLNKKIRRCGRGRKYGNMDEGQVGRGSGEDRKAG